ncbi:hypothetical protein V492_00151 [Pseudogymnoascus sp. VKM F-4246]|nr:hypothetical protein V492_00151 [Pseudogymnoascus sp. VKM F-4246]
MSDEKTAADLEAQTTASSATLPPNNTHLETEKIETGSIASSTTSRDYDHAEIEAMDAGRQTDLAIDRVHSHGLIKTASEAGTLKRTETKSSRITRSRTSTKAS